jgi:hypothetical protein
MATVLIDCYIKHDSTDHCGCFNDDSLNVSSVHLQSKKSYEQKCKEADEAEQLADRSTTATTTKQSEKVTPPPQTLELYKHTAPKQSEKVL